MEKLEQETKILQEGDIVAVYGTLRKGCSNYRNLGLESRAEYLGQDKVKGRLYTAPHRGYPFLTTGDDDVIVDLFEIKDGRLGRSLDGLEGYDPTSPQERNTFYLRTSVETIGGVKASIYRIDEKLDENLRIDSGDWIDFCENVRKN